MNQVIEFLEMGGYAAFVWPAYGATVIVMAAVALSSIRTLLWHQRELKRIEAGLARIDDGAAPKQP